MIQVGTPEDESTFSRGKTFRLILNGQLIEGSTAYRDSDGLRASIYEGTAATLLIQCQVAEIAQHFARLTLHFPGALNEYFPLLEMDFRRHEETKTAQLSFPLGPRMEYWAKPWSLFDFASTLERIVEDHSIPGMRYDQPAPDAVIEGELRIELHTSEETVQQVLDHWFPIIRDICEEVEASLTSNIRKGSLLALFNFAPEVKTACEQYLLYFVQFLDDLGIQATAALQEQARGVFFTVTPKSGPEALGRIRDALDLYLQTPGSPDFDAEVTRHRDVAVQQYAANVYHLRAQLTLAQAVLESKNATIENLQAANLQYRQLLSANPQSQGQLPGQSSDATQRDESLLGGTVILTKTNLPWGFQLDLASMFRTLKRRLSGER